MRNLIVALGLLGLSACGGGEPSSKGVKVAVAESSDGLINVYNWSDYVAPDTIANFEQASGKRVNYQTYSGNAVLDQKLREKSGNYDVVFPSARPYAQGQLEQGLLLKLDRSKLPNWQHLDAETLKALSAMDPGNEHLVPYLWGTTGLGLNVAQVSKALGSSAGMDSWNLLFNPVMAEKLSSCGIGILDDDQEGHSAALIALGRSPNGQSDADLQAVREAFAGIRPYIRKFGNSSALIDDLASGSLCVVLSYSGDIGQAQAKARETLGEKAPEIRYVIPREGALRWMDVIAIPADAPHAELAHSFINYLLEPKVIAEISNHVAYANANRAATAWISKDISSNEGIYPPSQVVAKLVDPAAHSAEQIKHRADNWNAIVYDLMR
jgi:putrescine transport system substrate-binding protein